MQHLIPAILAVPLIVAFASPLLGRAGARLRDAFVLLAFLALLPMTFMLWQQVSAYGAQNYVFGALSPAQTTVMLPSGYSLPVRIVLSVDALGAFAALLSAVVALSAVLYSLSFMGKAGRHFYPLLSLMALGMLGISFTGDLFNLFVFLEVLSISSAALVAYDRSRGEASEAAFKYLVVSAVAALFVLFAVALLYGQYGAVNIAFLAGLLQYSFLDKVALALLVAGLAMKVGAVPMHMWSPDAYGESPAPVTIMLVAASAVCLYALFRVCFSLFGFAADAAVVGWALIILGVLSMVVGVTMALVQKDIKRLMAYHCVSQIGYMLLGVGVGMAVLSDPVALASYGFSAV
ncbi:MAG: NADH:ubiquinone oxidoreductase, partial [Candidatus Diapherotrites archaeon]|nr:NADH:ubiquinone oxidoreductase [Candidatus Diapherotrites archaeon]